MAAAVVLDFKNLKILTVRHAKNVELLHCAQFRLNRSNRGRDMAIFQDGGRRHLGFSKFQIFNCRNGYDDKLHHRDKFRRNRSNHGRDMAIFDFFNMAAVRHLGFVTRGSGPPTKGIWWSLSLCKIWLKSML